MSFVDHLITVMHVMSTDIYFTFFYVLKFIVSNSSSFVCLKTTRKREEPERIGEEWRDVGRAEDKLRRDQEIFVALWKSQYDVKPSGNVHITYPSIISDSYIKIIHCPSAPVPCVTMLTMMIKAHKRMMNVNSSIKIHTVFKDVKYFIFCNPFPRVRMETLSSNEEAISIFFIMNIMWWYHLGERENCNLFC